MLILSRRVGEKIIIQVGGDIIEVVPVRIDGQQVKLGVHAPAHVSVHREEIAERIRLEQQA